MKAIIGIYFYM